jgi:phosphoenolpyruvate carboxylase
VIPDAELAKLRTLSDLFSNTWKPTIEALAPLINRVAKAVPPRRERLQHIGLFGYSRGVGKVKLPRAIGFTAALYSVGVPPELISTGRGLAEARKHGMMDLLETYYPALRADLQHAGKFLNRENLDAFASADPAFAAIRDGIAAIEKTLGIELGPEKPHHLIHRNLTSSIRLRLDGDDDAALQRDLVEAAVIRKSIG